MPSLIGQVRAGVLLLLLAAVLPCHAERDRVSFGHDITVREGETTGDVVCAFCTVHVRGDVKGDVVVFFGRVAVDPGRSVAGDIASFGSKVELAAGSTAGQDVAVFGGTLAADKSASIRGDRVGCPVFCGCWDWLLRLFSSSPQ